MGDDLTGKRDIKVNDFKAPVDWYARVKAIAHERRCTIPSAIIHLVDLGFELFDTLKEGKQGLIDDAAANYKKKRSIAPKERS